MKSRCITYSHKKHKFVVSEKCKLKLEFKPKPPSKAFQGIKNWKTVKGVYKCYIRYQKDKVVVVFIMNTKLLGEYGLWLR